MAEKIKKVSKKKVAPVAEPAPVAVAVEALVAVAAPEKAKAPKARPNLYIVLFTIEGGLGYRCSTFSSKEQWKTYLAAPGQKNHPKPLTEKWFFVDMINGTITEEK